MNKYQIKILAQFKPHEYYNYQGIFKLLRINVYSQTTYKYRRAWLDLIAMGKLHEGIGEMYRLNQ